MNSTAIQRNMMQTPLYVSFALFVTCYLGYWFLVHDLHWNPFALFAGSVVSGVILLGMMDNLASWLTRRRFVQWASEVRGIHPDDYDDFLARTSPEELENMVAYDFEGTVVDDEEEAVLQAIEDGK